MNKIAQTLSVLVCVFLFSVIPIISPNAQAEGCFSIVVGKDASENGNVIMGHNEDDSPPAVVNHRKIPRKNHAHGESVELLNGGRLDQVEKTWAYIWSEMPDLRFSDSYVNEWGVCIASDNCPSRENRPQLTDGGISYMLRRVVAQRAKSAREGVHIAAELVEHFGYDASGRTYIICDPEEGWLFCVINGKHWLAARVPDDEVAVVANTFTVHNVDLSDTANMLASNNIIDYAVFRGWYDPEAGKDFDFAAAYADPEAFKSESNLSRQWGGLRLIAERKLQPDDPLPFSVKPASKMDVTDVMHVLRDHYEGTDLYRISSENGSPHEAGVHSICNSTTQTAFVVELDKDLPADVGIVYWVCLGSPCTSFFVPFHFGMEKFPAAYITSNRMPFEDYYKKMIERQYNTSIFKAFWKFVNFRNKVHSDFTVIYPELKSAMESYEKQVVTLRQSVVKTALGLYPEHKDAALGMLDNFSHSYYANAVKTMDKIMESRKSR